MVSSLSLFSDREIPELFLAVIKLVLDDDETELPLLCVARGCTYILNL